MHSITTWTTPSDALKWLAQALAATRDSIEPSGKSPGRTADWRRSRESCFELE